VCARVMGSYKECEGFSATADYQRVVGSLSDAVNVSRSRRRDVVSQRAGHGRRTSPQTTLPGDDLKPVRRSSTYGLILTSVSPGVALLGLSASDHPLTSIPAPYGGKCERNCASAATH
jgi:hypothetical protein